MNSDPKIERETTLHENLENSIVRLRYIAHEILPHLKHRICDDLIEEDSVKGEARARTSLRKVLVNSPSEIHDACESIEKLIHEIECLLFHE